MYAYMYIYTHIYLCMKKKVKKVKWVIACIFGYLPFLHLIIIADIY